VGVLCIRSILSVFPSDLPGVNLATLNGMLLYYHVMTKWSGLGDSTEVSRVGLSQLSCGQSELTTSGSKTKTLHSREGRLVGGRTPCAGKEE
jgi:hypothetical protein